MKDGELSGKDARRYISNYLDQTATKILDDIEDKKLVLLYEDAIIDSDIWIRSNNITFSRIAFDLYYGNVYALSYGWNSVYGNGWTDSVYRTLNIYDFPLLPYPESSEREKTTNILDVIALIGRNATYQGSADPWTRIYKLGWRVQNNS